MIIISNEGVDYGTNDKMIVDTYRFVRMCKWHLLPQNVPYKMFKHIDGLKKPSAALKDRPWKPLQRRAWIKKNPDKKNQFIWKTTDAQEMKLKKQLMKEKNESGFDTLAHNFNLYQLDNQLSSDYKWDEDDRKDDGTETMEERHLRKSEEIREELYAKYDPKGDVATQHPELVCLTKEITNTFKRMAYINSVWKASPRNWLSVFFNAGAYYFVFSKFIKTASKHFDFLDQKGMKKLILCLKIYILQTNIFINIVFESLIKYCILVNIFFLLSKNYISCILQNIYLSI